MAYNTILIRLYYLLICADGSLNQKEIDAAKQMVAAEALSEIEFQAEMKALPGRDQTLVYSECIRAMKLLSHTQQIRIIAWLCVLANADGFMDRAEWQFIYKIYQKELTLPLNEIFQVQKDINFALFRTKFATIL